MVFREKEALNPLGKPLPPKVAHRASDTVKVSQGNHSVTGLKNPHAVDGMIEILHFPIRSYQQIENKIALGGSVQKKPGIARVNGDYLAKIIQQFEERWKSSELFR